MARIVFVVDYEEGHLLSTFKLARQLVERGHAVSYLGLEDSAPLVARQGFDFVPILSQVFPRGSVNRWRSEKAGGAAAAGPRKGEPGAHKFYDQYLGTLARGEGLDDPVRSVQPDLFLLNSIMVPNALVLHYRFGIPIVLLTPHLRAFTRLQTIEDLEAEMMRMSSAIVGLTELVRRKNPTARRLRDITAPLFQLPELVQCPQEFDLPRAREEFEPNVHYIEPSLDMSRRDDRNFPWEWIDPQKKLLFVSLGSQAHLAGRETVLSFLRAVAEGAARRPEWQLVVSTGGVVEAADLPLPADALAFPWVPQIPILERSALMVNHGGAGTVKECIFLGVPMVSYPIGRDQPETIRRVVHHGLGLGGELAGATPEGIFSLIEQVDREPRFRENVARMRRCFHEAEAAQLGVSLIEEALERSAVHSRMAG